MKKILYSLLFIFTVVFTACEEDLPKASFDLYGKHTRMPVRMNI